MQLLADRIMSFDSISKQYFMLIDQVCRFVEVLADKGLVERFRHPLFEGIRITLRGEQLLERGWLILEYVQAMLYKDFTQQERLQLEEVWERLAKNCYAIQ